MIAATSTPPLLLTDVPCAEGVCAGVATANVRTVKTTAPKTLNLFIVTTGGLDWTLAAVAACGEARAGLSYGGVSSRRLDVLIGGAASQDFVSVV
jgi:hypothetical protein